MARIIQNVKDYEVWKSAIAGTIFVKRYDRAGDLTNERVSGGRTISLLPEERRINQEAAASPDLDVFQNGQLVPVRLVESADDVEELRDNPNHLSEDEMKSLLKDKRTIKALEDAIAGVSNPVTLQRFLQIATTEDASMKQVAVLEARLQVVSGAATYIEHETVMGPDGRPVVQTHAPESPAPRR